MKIGIYGGTFDPVHIGHLLLARDAVESLGLDVLIFSPNRVSPHKLAVEPAPGEARLAMLRAAIEGEPRFRVDGWELGREAPSFSVELAEHVAATAGGGATLYFLVGADNLAQLETWHRHGDLARLVRFVVLGRNADTPPHPFPEIARRIDVSSTEIRARIREGKSARHLVPDNVLDIMKSKQLYEGNYR
jgi:nicotinate-nucleotide adenylyltransferase